ncbi:MAG: ATP-grasp domain-containing protein [Candidatus Binatia bacterium]
MSAGPLSHIPTGSTLRPLRCLCTSVGNDGFVAVHAALKAFYGEAITVIGCDVRPDAYGLYLADKGYLVPRRDEPDFAERLLDILAREECSVVYPLSTFDQEYFAAHREIFEHRGIGVVVSDLNAVSTANNKLKLYDLCQEAELPVAAYVAVQDQASLGTALHELGYPRQSVVFKVSRGTAARGLFIVREGESIFDSLDRNGGPPEISAAELAQILVHSPAREAILCEYLPGDEYSVDVLSWHGESLVSVVRRRYASVGGLALHAEVIDDPELRGLAEAVVRRLHLSFTSNVQFRRNDRGTPCVMEVNPRIPGTIGLTVQAGVNMPALALELALGRHVPRQFSIDYGLRIMRYWGGLYHRDGLLS